MVQEILYPKDYIGVSTDTKPIATTGSTFYETDTKLGYIWNGSAWVVL